MGAPGDDSTLVEDGIEFERPAIGDEGALPIDPGTISASDVTQKSTDVPDPTTTRRRGKSVSSPSHPPTALAPAAHPVATGSATVKTRVATATSRPAQSKANARNSNDATPGTGGRRVGPTSKPTHPSHSKNPVH